MKRIKKSNDSAKRYKEHKPDFKEIIVTSNKVYARNKRKSSKKSKQSKKEIEKVKLVVCKQTSVTEGRDGEKCKSEKVIGVLPVEGGRPYSHYTNNIGAYNAKNAVNGRSAEIVELDALAEYLYRDREMDNGAVVKAVEELLNIMRGIETGANEIKAMVTSQQTIAVERAIEGGE